MSESFVNASAPSILNDVLGPVMRGPSSSHTAASYRIGLMLKDLAGGKPVKALFEFHPGGSLATTHFTQGSDMGLAAGLCGLNMLDAEMPRSLEIARKAGIDIEFRISDYPADHPNTYKCTVHDSEGRILTARAESIGGGMFRFTEIMGHSVDLQGDEVAVHLVEALLLSCVSFIFPSLLVQLIHGLQVVLGIGHAQLLLHGGEVLVTVLQRGLDIGPFAPVVPRGDRDDVGAVAQRDLPGCVVERVAGVGNAPRP